MNIAYQIVYFYKEEGWEINMLDFKYLLATMTAKRANQLENGAKPLVETKYRKPTLIALEEIKAGKVFIKEKKEPFKAEDVFHEEEESLKVEESVKPEEPERAVKLSDKDEKPAEIEEMFIEVEESVKPEGISDKVKKPKKIKEGLSEVKKPKKLSDKVKKPKKSKG